MIKNIVLECAGTLFSTWLMKYDVSRCEGVLVQCSEKYFDCLACSIPHLTSQPETNKVDEKCDGLGQRKISATRTSLTSPPLATHSDQLPEYTTTFSNPSSKKEKAIC